MNTVFVACHSDLIRKRLLWGVKVEGDGKRQRRIQGVVEDIPESDIEVCMSDDEMHS